MRRSPLLHSELEVEVLTEPAELERLAPEWLELCQACPGTPPFQYPEWLLPWWRHCGGGELSALAFRAAGRLVGLAPVFFYTWQGRRQASPMGLGISDYQGCLFAPEYAAAGAAIVWQHLLAEQDRWEVADFQELPAASPLLAARLPPDLQFAQLPQSVCPVVALPATVEALWAGLAPHPRRNLRRARRLLAEAGRVEYETATPDSLPGLLQALFDLHEARWRACGEHGVLAEPAIQAFHREAALGLLRRGCLRLHALRLDGRVATVFYGFALGRRLYAYLTGFDPALRQASPGALIVAHAMEQAIQAGLAEFDFLRGREDHKQMWGAVERLNYRLLVWHRHSPASLSPWLAQQRAEAAA